MADEYDPVTGLHVLRKQPTESLLFDLEFGKANGKKGKLREGDTIASIGSVAFTNMGKVSGSSDVTLGTNAFSGTLAQVRISAGQSGEQYKITFIVTTTPTGDTVEAEGLLNVDEI